MDITIYKTFKFTSGDEISHYKAEFKENPTLDEFVRYLLTDKSGEWGYVERSILDKLVEYRHGRIVSLCNDYDSIKNRKIKLERMDGGWSRMDYTVKVL